MTSEPGLEALIADADALRADPRFTALLRAHWPGLFRAAGARPGRALSTRIHPGDQMLLHSLRHHRDANAAVAQYFNVALQQYQAARQVLDATFAPGARPVAVLDFACGFGRLLRFLSCCERDDLEITASEIQAEALDFVGTEFGVATVASAMQPEAFEPGRRFDFIWVASLFSHLPEGLFHRWLQRLLALLTPEGVLCFSVHDQRLAPRTQAFPDHGLLFQAHSENADLDAEAYGTTYVSERFVRAAIAHAGEPTRPVHRLPSALAHEQDLYVVAAGTARSLASLVAFRRGPWGWVDERRCDDHTLVLRGWAASIDDGALPHVTVHVDGTTHRVPTGLERADVRDAFADARLLHAGWRFELKLPGTGPAPWVEVTAHTPRGESALLYVGWPGGRSDGGAPAKVYRREVDLGARSTLSLLAAMVAPGSRVLDLGSGDGTLGRTLREQRGCRVDGVTISAAEQALARPWYERIERLDLEDPDWATHFESGAYDCIVCADVLEHLREPEAVLAACARLLREDGWLLISVPNVAYAGMVLELMHGDWKYGPEGLLDHTHLRFFTRRSFTRLLEAGGWRVARVEPVDASWYYTEFWTPFDRLPPAVARYLLAQPDASAYQLVFAARRASARAGTPPGVLPAPDPEVSVAVYATALRTGAQRSHRLGRVGAAAQTIGFELPADWAPGTPIEWQIADRPGYLHLHALRLRDRFGAIAWQWRAEVDGDGPLRSARHEALVVGVPPSDRAPLPLLLLSGQARIDLPVPGSLARHDGGPWRLEVVCGWPLSADYLALLPSSPAPSPATTCSTPVAPGSAGKGADPTVEIVLPVYGGLPVLRRCIDSLLTTRGRADWHLTIIDDASPDPEVGRWLRELALVRTDFTVVTNARNLGFVATVNLGMRLAGRRDVLLLNSDTEVAGDWLDRLRRAAHSQPRAGTVTPFSNNATICSWPNFCEDNPLPPGRTVPDLQRVFGLRHDGATLEIPTAVGFCMYIRRDCLDEVGEFDAATFGAGYGEENDFCLRASARGWRHLHALDTFVYHAGGASFSGRQQELQVRALAAIRRLHPGYEDLVRAFVARDPARAFRDAVPPQETST